jgi:hypothetical protein
VDLAAGLVKLPVTLEADTAPSTPPDKHGKARSAGY